MVAVLADSLLPKIGGGLAVMEWIGILAGLVATIVILTTVMKSFSRCSGLAETRGGMLGLGMPVCFGLILIGSASAFVKFFVY